MFFREEMYIYKIFFATNRLSDTIWKEFKDLKICF